MEFAIKTLKDKLKSLRIEQRVWKNSTEIINDIKKEKEDIHKAIKLLENHKN